MSCYRIFYVDKQKMCQLVSSRQQFLALRNEPRHLSLLAKARSGNADAKRHLLQFNYSCIPASDMRLKGCQTPSMSVGMDVDFPPSPESPIEACLERILSLRSELGLLLLERSVSKGFHMVFRRQPHLSQEDNLRWASSLIGVPFDQNAKDITRVFFASSASESDILFLDDALFSSEAAPSAASPEPSPVAPVAAAVASSPEPSLPPSDVSYPSVYNGKNYSDIVSALESQLGGIPAHGSRNTFIFSMACHLRYICNDDPRWIMSILPTYGEARDKWSATIHSACQRRQTVSTPRILLRAVDIAPSVSEASPADEPPAPSIDASLMPLGVRDSLASVESGMALPVIVAICPMIGALATHVKVNIHGQVNSLNLMSYIAGNAASGKGRIDSLVHAWMGELLAQDDIFHKREAEYRAKKKSAKNSEHQPEEPKFPVRFLTLNNTVANIADRLSNTDGTHSFSFTPEADTVALKWRQSISDFSVMLRQAYDGSRYDREARSAEAVTVHIKRLLWNVVLCGTPDALYRVITNYSDGLLTRFAIASTPDNTFMALEDNPKMMTDDQRTNIASVAHLLQLMEGSLNLPLIEQTGRQWLENVRVEAMKNDDRIMASQRMRICVTTQRMVTCLMLCAVAEQLLASHTVTEAEQLLSTNANILQQMMEQQQTDAMLRTFNIIADSLMENVLRYFRDKIQNAILDSSSAAACQRSRRGRNDTIFDSLPPSFSVEQAMSLRGSTSTRNGTIMMLRNWIRQGLITQHADGRYVKLSITAC